jgi:hypothetical protein
MPKYWIRTVKFQTENLEIKMPGIHIEFNIEFSDESDGNVGEVVLYNLKNETIEGLKAETQFILKAGYKEHNGIVLPGIIKKSVTQWDKVDKVTTLIVGDNTEAWLRSTVNKTWKANSKASQIAPELIKNTGLSVGEIDLVEDVTYEKGVTFSTTNRKALEEIAADTGSKLHSSRGKIYLRPSKTSNRRAILLNSDTGLISSPEKTDEEDSEKYTVLSLFNYKIQTDTLIRLESKTVEGNFRVIEGEHVCQGDNYQTKMEVEMIEGNQ